ncbi:unnamed protein product [Alternaria burnsii]|nr:unnamed protein product [Alternaria burnsii]
MEVAGVVIGAVALIGVFEDCVELFSQIGAAKSMGKDYILLATRLDLQRALLLQWAERMHIYDEETYDARLNEATVASLIYRTLGCIRQLLQDGNVLQQRYGVRAAEASETTESSTTVSNSLMARIRDMSLTLQSRRDARESELERSRYPQDSSGINSHAKRSWSDYVSSQSDQAESSHRRPDNNLQNKRPRYDTYRSRFEHPSHNLHDDRQSKSSLSGNIKWVIRDKDQFDSLVRKLSELISDIDRLVPPRSGGTSHTILARDLQDMSSVRELRKIMYASITDNSELVNITEQAIDAACTKLILDHLWFRLIDDRRNNVVEAHSNTLEWAIRPPASDVAWDDLGEWLRSGPDIYWIHGKPGSGKSTLMKFLFHHPQVVSFLQEWAGERKLTVASFFLWNIGAVEQSSQEGLARGLLHHVLKQNPTLTPEVLPYMWQEAQSGVVGLRLPSHSEMKTAFQQIGNQQTKGAFAFFIDGLDEFTGNHRDGISFVKSFITSANIKIIVSSRPIDSCVAAFSSAPKLKLQDLTEPDIERYINDVLRSHPYVRQAKCVSDATLEGLVEDIQSKASGVFLWVVLACRTLTEGFEAYDDADELRRRVDELPPELEQLFRHILNGLPTRFIQQSAKLLRVCYTSRKLHFENRIPAFRLAWAHEKDMKTDAMGEFIPDSLNERKARSAMLKGRLRSRCRGLLEVTTKDYDLVNGPSVVFMHRTVFEFLCTPGVWEMECLRIDDHEFDATTVLAYMVCYLLCAQKTTFHEGKNVIYTAFLYMQEIEATSIPTLGRLLNRFAYALMQPVSDIQIPSTRPGFAPAVDESALLLAIELDLVAFVESHDLRDLRKIVTLRKLHNQDASTQWSLLYHALKKPMLFKRLATPHGYPYSSDMINILLQAGCNPNERIAVSGTDKKTCWEIWMESGCMVTFERTPEIRSAEITMLMIRGGALVRGTHFDGEQDKLKSLLQTVGDPQSAAKRIEDLQDRRKWIALCNEIAEAVAPMLS